MRLFVALEIPSTVRGNLAALIENFRNISQDPKWVRPGNLHVTLKFLGEVPDARMGAIREALGKILSEQSVTLQFRGVGFFPNEKHPRVFWAGIQASPNLARLAGDIEAAMEKCGIAREERVFSPHLTLARIESRRLSDKLRAGIGENMQRDFGTLQTNEFHLIQSKLKPSGAEYITLARFAFAPSEA